MVDASRRGFFRGRPHPRAEIRPPWALDEAAFIDACTHCNDCLGACPEHIVVAGDGGFPTIDFRRGECTFCGDCASACKTGALQRSEGRQPWLLKAKIGPVCLPPKSLHAFLGLLLELTHETGIGVSPATRDVLARMTGASKTTLTARQILAQTDLRPAVSFAEMQAAVVESRLARAERWCEWMQCGVK